MNNKENELLWKEFFDFCKINNLKPHYGSTVRLFFALVKGVSR